MNEHKYTQEQVIEVLKENRFILPVVKHLKLFYGCSKNHWYKVIAARILKDEKSRTLEYIKTKAFTLLFWWEPTPEGDTFWRFVDTLAKRPMEMHWPEASTI